MKRNIEIDCTADEYADVLNIAPRERADRLVSKEYDRRVYYQDLVYRACTLLEHEKHHPVFVGTIEQPSAEFVSQIAQVIEDKHTLNKILFQLQDLLGVQTNTSALSKVAVLMREENEAEILLSKALGHLHSCSESGSEKLYKEIAAAFGVK